VIAAIVVRLAVLDRPVALPVGFALVRKTSDDSSRLELARRLVEAITHAGVAHDPAGGALYYVVDDYPHPGALYRVG